MTYYILLIITILLAANWGKRKHANKSILLFLLPVLFYSITYGFRKDWAVDYVVYQSVYEGTHGSLDIQNFELLFREFVTFLQAMGCDFHVLLILVSITTIAAPMLLVKDHKDISYLALPIFLLMCSYQASNLVRFFFAFSIMNIGIYYLLQEKFKLTLVYAVAGVLIHTGTILLIPFILLFYRFEIMKNTKVVYACFIITFTMGSISEYASDSNVMFVKTAIDFALSFLADENQLNKYNDVDVISGWILGEKEDYVMSVFFLSSRLLLATGFIFLGKKVLSLIEDNSSKKYFFFFYQMVCFALIIENITSGTEILTRLTLYFKYMTFIPVGMILYYSKQLCKRNIILLTCMYVGVLYNCFYEQKQLTEFDLLYVWD